MIDVDRLARWDRPGPRYTSYPTAPTWRSDFTDAAYQDAVRALGPRCAVYVHLPFCREQCTFCGCTMVVAGKHAIGERYLAALEKQIDGLAFAGRREAAVVHLGGGTPTWFTADELDRLFAALRRRFDFTGEVSVEIDPDVTSIEQLDRLVAQGVTRISIGVQSFDPAVLEAVRRPQDERRIVALIARARELGLKGLNLDLIYGLPKQDAASVRATVKRAIELGADRLALYSFAYVPWAKPHQKRLDAGHLPDAPEKLRSFQAALETLEEAGYEAIGFDHFARPDDDLAVARREERLHRNFMGFNTWPDLPMIGLGMSAISDLGGVWAQQRSGLMPWLRAIENGDRLVEKGFSTDADDALRGDVIERLLCNLAVDWDAVSARHGVDAEDLFADAIASLQPMVDEGFLRIRPGRLEITDDGRLLARVAAMAFDRYLGHDNDRRFSRAV